MAQFGSAFAWGAKGHEFESHYSDQENHRSRTMVFSLSKAPEMLILLHEKHGKQIEMREKKGESAFARKTVKTLVKQKGDQK